MKRTQPLQNNTSLKIEFDREIDGRWIAEVPSLPVVMAYGSTKRNALIKVQEISLFTLNNLKNKIAPLDTNVEGCL
jgi:predicted RNase H-like HicB family nuclease